MLWARRRTSLVVTPAGSDVRAHEAALVERLLDEMHVGVPGAFEFTEGGERGRAGYQQNRDAVAK